MNTALNRTSVALLTNKSGGSVAQGDVVIVDSTTAAAFTTTTTSAYVSGSVGVVLEPNGIASNAIGSVAFGGYVPIVNLSGSASLGDVFKTHTVAKQAVRHAGPIVAGDFGQVLGTGTTPAAFLWGQPSGGGGGGGGSSTLAGDTDVNISGPANLDLLQYQTGDSKWHNVQGGIVRLAEVVVGGGGSATIDFSSIPGTYRKLHLDGMVRGDTAAQDTSLIARFNADSGTNYDRAGNFQGSGTGNLTGAGLTSVDVGFATAASMLANSFAGFDLDILQYANTNMHKSWFARGWLLYGSGASVQADFHAGDWRSTAALTSISFSLGAGNFVQFSVVTLYGIA